MIEEICKIKALPIEQLSESAISGYSGSIFYLQINNVYYSEEKALI